ncbi:hypothetical protein [Desulfonema magnum]|uniref:Uncharacterized protein n=1 Tax=Desulfonema magnum TaxID=45655 RepID=A0A975BQQ9_9BACT|nr:hypothetical protein [Desulfonema magnum]QTA89335.1 Uncharacterized protein dnm_053850 [Desulfonema magnum]
MVLIISEKYLCQQCYKDAVPTGLEKNTGAYLCYKDAVPTGLGETRRNISAKTPCIGVGGDSAELGNTCYSFSGGIYANHRLYSDT